MPLQGLAFTLLQLARHIHHFVEQFDHIKAVKSDLRLKERLSHSGHEVRRHIHADLDHLPRSDFLAGQIELNRYDGFPPLAGFRMEEAPGVPVDPAGDAVMLLAAGRLVEPKAGFGEGGIPLARLADPMVQHRPDPLDVDAQHHGDSIDGHFPLNQGLPQGFKEQHEATARPHPGHLHRLDLVLAAGLDPGNLAMQVASVLEEVQMLPGALDCIVHEARSDLGVDKLATTRKAQRQVKFLPARRTRLEFNAIYLPMRVQAQGHAEKLFAVHGCRAHVRVASP